MNLSTWPHKRTHVEFPLHSQPQQLSFGAPLSVKRSLRRPQLTILLLSSSTLRARLLSPRLPRLGTPRLLYFALGHILLLLLAELDGGGARDGLGAQVAAVALFGRAVDDGAVEFARGSGGGEGGFVVPVNFYSTIVRKDARFVMWDRVHAVVSHIYFALTCMM